MMDDLLGVLLAGGYGQRMGNLCKDVPKSLVPFAGSCRLIDFSLQSAVESQIPEVVLLLQHQSDAIIKHCKKHWLGNRTKLNFCGRDTGLMNYEKELGTAHALWLNRKFIEGRGYKDLIVLHCDHVYNQNHREFYEFHRDSKAALTFSYTNIDIKYAHLFGVLELDVNDNVVRFEEKPSNPLASTISAGVWIFDVPIMMKHLDRIMKNGECFDISRGLIPSIIEEGNVVKAFPFKGYWEDVGTLERYYEAHIDLLKNRENQSFIHSMPKTLPIDKRCNYYHDPSNGIENSLLHESMLARGLDIKNSVIYNPRLPFGSNEIADSVVYENEGLIGQEKFEKMLISGRSVFIKM
ncbi:MAG: sugar phosphate nucleotidyltransferase [Formosimonas sp.]